jgi:alpha-galactosidase
MTDEMLVAQAEWLPQFAAEIPAARTRLEQAERNGTRVQTREYQGAARLHTRTVAEMALDQTGARANADAADKGKLTKST